MENNPAADQYIFLLNEFYNTPFDAPDFKSRLDALIEIADKAASIGYEPAQSWLGQTLYYGYYGAPVDKEQALKLLAAAAKKDDFPAAYELACIYSGDEYRRFKKCAKLLLPMIDTYPRAKAKFGELLHTGKITHETYELEGIDDYIGCGLGLLEQAASEGSSLAYLILAEISYQDMDDPERKEKAYDLIEKGLAAFALDGEKIEVKAALLRYKGNALMSGLGTPMDIEQARTVLEEATNLGDHAAYEFLNQLNGGIPGFVPQSAGVKVASFDADERIAGMLGWEKPRVLYEQIHKFSMLQLQMGAESRVPSPHFILSGPPGTGKNIFIEIITRKLHDIGYLAKPEYVECDLLDCHGCQDILREKLEAAKNALFVLKDTRKYLGGDSNTYDMNCEQRNAKSIFQFLSDTESRSIVCLYQEEEDGDLEMDRFLAKYPDLARSIRLRGQFEHLKAGDILEILKRRFQDMNVDFPDSLQALATQEIQRRMDQGNLLSTNAHIVVDMVFETLLKMATERKGEESWAVTPEVLPLGNWHQTKNVEEILKPLNSMVGLQSVKDDIENLTYLLKAQKDRAEKHKTIRPIPAPHFIFTGPPGTGKTTVARMLGKILQELGYLSRGHIIETDGTSMIGKYMGHSAPIVRDLMDRADGGILFIDEAYILGQHGDSSYRDPARDEAVASLLKLIEDRRGRVVVIAAGYSKEMHNFLESNSGIKSRFSHTVDFENYSPAQLVEIFIQMCERESMQVSQEAIEKLRNKVRILRTNDQITEFGNARGIRNIFEKTIGFQARRVLLDGVQDELSLNRIEAADFPFGRPLKPELTVNLEESLEPLRKMIGLKAVKDEIERLTYVAQSQMARERAGLPPVPLVLHSLFTGAPGTGKTSVARLFGKILADLGYLSRGHVVEVDQSNLIGSWLGQTPQRVKEQANLADGGILFVDEAYTLAGHNGAGASFGQEALTTLLKLMEDRRDRFVVIAAGYTKEMDEFLKANSGLLSRFPNHLVFESYSHQEMLEILKLQAAEYGIAFDDGANAKVLAYLQNRDKDKLDSMGNGRLIRNIFEKTIGSQAKRVLQGGLPDAELKIIREVDVTFPKDSADEKVMGFARIKAI